MTIRGPEDVRILGKPARLDGLPIAGVASPRWAPPRLESLLTERPDLLDWFSIGRPLVLLALAPGEFTVVAGWETWLLAQVVSRTVTRPIRLGAVLVRGCPFSAEGLAVIVLTLAAATQSRAPRREVAAAIRPALEEVLGSSARLQQRDLAEILGVSRQAVGPRRRSQQSQSRVRGQFAEPSGNPEP